MNMQAFNSSGDGRFYFKDNSEQIIKNNNLW